MWNSVDSLSSQKSCSSVRNAQYTKPTNHLGAWRSKITFSITGLDASNNLTEHNYPKTERTTTPPINHQKKERKHNSSSHSLLPFFLRRPSYCTLLPYSFSRSIFPRHITTPPRDCTLHKKGNSGGRGKRSSSAYVLVD